MGSSQACRALARPPRKVVATGHAPKGASELTRRLHSRQLQGFGKGPAAQAPQKTGQWIQVSGVSAALNRAQILQGYEVPDPYKARAHSFLFLHFVSFSAKKDAKTEKIGKQKF